jgi:hypothetical protein
LDNHPGSYTTEIVDVLGELAYDFVEDIVATAKKNFNSVGPILPEHIVNTVPSK